MYITDTLLTGTILLYQFGGLFFTCTRALLTRLGVPLRTRERINRLMDVSPKTPLFNQGIIRVMIGYWGYLFSDSNF